MPVRLVQDSIICFFYKNPTKCFTFGSDNFDIGGILLLRYLRLIFVFVVCSIGNTTCHYCCQLGFWVTTTCGQLCPHRRICIRVSSWICVSDAASVWMGESQEHCPWI